jgi:predicted kinase
MTKSPVLYLFIGYPGAGKTTVAQLIENHTGATHIWADTERHKMFPEPTHSVEESQKLYDALNERTARLLAGGRSVIFDTNFNHRADRDLLRDIASKNLAQTVLIWMTTPREIAKQRAVHDQIVRNGYDYAMDEAQFDAIADKLEPPTEDENALKIDGTHLDLAEVTHILNLV